MTGKEALERIKTAPEYSDKNSVYKRYDNSYIPFMNDIKQIEKDLEILEILKSKLVIIPSADSKTTYLIAKFNEEYNRDTVYPFIKSGEYEALEKIKEWLNEK